MPESSLKVIHVKSLRYIPPSQTFVHARVLNPICSQPVPLIAGWVYPQYRQCKEIEFYEEAVFHGLNDEDKGQIFFEPIGACSSLFQHQIISQVQPQLIHAHFARGGERCLSTAQWLGIPLIVNFYGMETKWQIYDSNWLPRIQRLYAQADAFICSSDAMKKDMINSGCSEDKITVIRCGIDIDFFDGEVFPWQSGQTLHLLTIARLREEKGLSYLLKACQLLNQFDFTNWQLKIIGTGLQEAALKQQVQENGLQNQVDFLGDRSPQEVRSALREAHLHILPSLRETQGVVLQEAQATCTPIIATNIGGIPEGVLEGESGLLVEPKSPSAILEAIQKFLAHPEWLVQMGHAGRNYITKNFSRQNEYQQLSRLYQSLLN